MLVPVLAPGEVDLVNTLGLNAMLTAVALAARVVRARAWVRTRSRWAGRGVHRAGLGAAERMRAMGVRC